MKQSTHRSETAQGASPVVIVLYGCLLLATVFTGIYLYINRPTSTAAPAAASALRTYTDTAKLYTLSYPAGWTLRYDLVGGTEGLAPVQDWAHVSRGYTLTNLYAPKGSQGVSVHVDQGDIVPAIIAGTTQGLDRFHTLQKLRINGYEAYYDKVDYVGPSAAEKYTDHYYRIVSGNILITLAFREKYYHNYPYDKWDDGQDLAAFQAIAHSVKFL